MPARQKLVIASLFLTAVGADIASILRVYYAYVQYKSGDTWELYPAAISGGFEMGLGQLCVSIATLKPLLSKFTSICESLSRSNHYKRNYYYGHGSQPTPRRDAFGYPGRVRRSDQPWAQQTRVYTDVDSNKSLDDEKFPGIKVTYMLEMGSMDHATGMYEETPKDSGTALPDQVILRH